MEKKIVRERIIHRTRRPGEPFRFENLLEYNPQPDDIIEMGFQEGWDHGDSMCENSEILEIYRDRLETDEEFEERKRMAEIQDKWGKKRRYEQYLKLKEEFEPEK